MKITAIVPAHDAEDFLAEAVASLLEQQEPPFEILVVDDASSDGTRALAESFESVGVVGLPEKRGPSAARNAGLERATGEAVVFLDADDLMPPGALAALASALHDDPEARAVKGRARIRHRQPDGRWRDGDLSDFPHHLGGSLFRRELFTTVGGLDETLRYGEDSDWHHRAVEAGVRFRLISEVTMIIRRHEANMTRGRNAGELGRLEVARRALRRRRTIVE